MAVQQLTDQEFKTTLSTNTKVVVKYFADWCGSCKLISPKYRRFSEDERYAGISFVDINAEQNEEARKMAGVDNLPFFAIFENGVFVEGVATSKPEKVEELLQKII
jgi:thiol-disulfide isomerase/thioredoxin